MYSPKIKEEQVRKLYKLKEKTEISMTELVEVAVDEFLKKYKEKIPQWKTKIKIKT